MLTTIEQAKIYFYDRCKAFGIDSDDTYNLWRNARYTITKAFVFIDNDYYTDAFLETTCNAIVNAWQIGNDSGYSESEKRS